MEDQILRSNNWMITKHFDEGKEPDTKEWLEDLFKRSKAVYLIGQSEIGMKEERFHIHAYMNFKNQQKLGDAKRGGLKKLDDNAHFTAVGRDNGVGRYCMKETGRVDGPFEFGVKPVRRNNKDDWEEVLEKAKEGRFEEIPASILVQNYGNIQKLYKDNMKVKGSTHLRGIFIWGKSGIGKSSLARDLFPNATQYNKSHNKWWDSYKGEEVVIWDDISPEEGKMSATFLKLYTDRYGIMGECKGSGVPLTYEFFIMTSQYSFEEVFADAETREAMERRCFIFHMYDDEHFGKSQFDMSKMLSKLYANKKVDTSEYIIRTVN